MMWPGDAVRERWLNPLREWRGNLSKKPNGEVIGIVRLVELKGLRQAGPANRLDHSILRLGDFDNHGPVQNGKCLIEGRGQGSSVGFRPANPAEEHILQHEFTDV